MKNNTYEECLMELAAHIKFDPKDQDYIAQNDGQGYQIPPFDDTITFNNYTEQEVIKLLGRKKIWNLTLLKPFVDFYKHKAQRKHISLLIISTTSTFFKMVYKSQKNVSNLLALAQKVSLIKCVDAKWSYAKGKAKVYAWNKNSESILISLFKSFNINIKQYQTSINQSSYNNIDRNIREEDILEASRRFNVKITSKTRLPISNELAAKMILDKYPQIKQLWQTLDEDNKSLEADEWTFAPLTIERSGSLKDSRISRIAIRARNSYCSAKVHDITEQDLISGRVLRDEVIKAKYGHVYEQDVKSSIYRVTYLLNKGVWLDDSIDLYEMIAGFKFETPEQRDLFKRPFCQKMYFSASPKDMKTKVCWNHQTTTRKYLEDNFGEATLLKARENMEKAIGFSYRSEIFLHESCIYAQVAHKLRTMGYKVFQVYDGFFTDKPLDRTTFNNIVKSEALSYYYKYINHNHNHNLNHHQYQSSYNNIDRNIRDNSDIPDEDSLIDIGKRRQEALQKHLFQKKGEDMTSREFARYNGGPVGHPDDDIPVNDIPVNDIPVNDIPVNDIPVMPMKKTAPMAKSDGWHKTALSKVGMEGDVMTFRDDRGYLQVWWKKIDTATIRNLTSVCRGSDAKWRVRWFSDSNGVRHATEVLTDEQYREYSKAAWQNHKIWREGFATANPFTA